MLWQSKPIPKSVKAKIDEIRGKTLYFSNDRLVYTDGQGNDYGRHEIDWLLANGLVAKDINFHKLVYEFRLAKYHEFRTRFD